MPQKVYAYLTTHFKSQTRVSAQCKLCVYLFFAQHQVTDRVNRYKYLKENIKRSTKKNNYYTGNKSVSFKRWIGRNLIIFHHTCLRYNSSKAISHVDHSFTFIMHSALVSVSFKLQNVRWLEVNTRFPVHTISETSTPYPFRIQANWREYKSALHILTQQLYNKIHL